MDSDELGVCILASVTAIFLWWRGAARARHTFAPACPAGLRAAVWLLPPGLLLLVLAALASFADAEVRSSPGYLTLFTAVGAVGMAAVAPVAGTLGVDLFADGLERGNPAAVVAVAGGWVAAAGLAVSANLGTGDVIWTTIFPWLVGGGLLGATWLAFGLVGRLGERIAGSRSLAAGLRLGSFAIAAAVPVAVAAAGNWVSYHATLVDFGRALPALGGLLALGWAGEFVGGWIPALLYPAAACALTFLRIAPFHDR